MKLKNELAVRNGKLTMNQSWERCKKLRRIPRWANKAKILAFYIKAQLLNLQGKTKYHVDHIIPLRGKLVSGLHNEFNLQIVTKASNVNKSNSFTPYIEDSCEESKNFGQKYYLNELEDKGVDIKAIELSKKKARKKKLCVRGVQKMAKKRKTVVARGKKRVKIQKKVLDISKKLYKT